MPRTVRPRGLEATVIDPPRRRAATKFSPLLQALERRALLATIIVPTNQPTIALAVSNANPNDTILVLPGTYPVPNVVINKPLTLISQNGAGSTFLDGANATGLPTPGSIRVANTTGSVVIGQIGKGFTFENPVTDVGGTTVSLNVRGNTAPVTVEGNKFVGQNGVNNPFDIGIWAYSTKVGGQLFVLNNDFSAMWQGILLEIPRGGANVLSNTFHNLVPSTDTNAGKTYEPEGIYALTYSTTPTHDPANDVSGLSIGSNDFSNFNGLAINVGGGSPGLAPAQFTNVAITNNTINAIGFTPNQFRAGITLLNDANNATEEPFGGVQGATVTGNTIAAQLDCSAGSIGVWVLGANNNLTVDNNFITGVDRGVLIQEEVPGAGFASGVAVQQDSITGTILGVENDSPNLVNASYNWWGTTVAQLVKAQANGGVNVNYNPWLGSGVDTSGAPGFQPDLTNLITDKLSINGAPGVVKNTPYTLNLVNNGSPTGNPITSYTVYFGDGPPQTVPAVNSSVNHTYTSAGNYVIVATATDSMGNVFNLSSTVPVGVTNFGTLQVLSVTPNPSGFSVRFNRQLDTTALHLYTSGLTPNSAGPPDVTLVGASTGPVRGTLIVDKDGFGFTFVKTGAPLPSDTYTVTLRGTGVNPIQATGASPALDGTASGTAGSDYTTTFTNTAARSVSIPDFMRGAGQPVNVPAAAGAVGLPVRLSDGTGVTTVDYFIHYDPTLLNVTNVQLASGLPAGTLFSTNTTVPGLIEVCLRSPTALPAGPANVFVLTANVPASAPYTSKEAIGIDTVSLNGGGIAATGDNAVHVAAYLGDANASATITSTDAFLVQRVAALIDSGLGAYKLADPNIVADINNDGAVTAVDAFLIRRYVALLPTPEIPAVPGIPVTPGGPDPLVSLPKGLVVAPGGHVAVPVSLKQTDHAPIGLDSFDLAIAFDPAAFTVAGVRVGSLAKGFELTWGVDAKLGLINISAVRPAGAVVLSPGALGSLAILDLVARPGATSGSRSLNLLDSAYAAGGSRSTRLNDGGLVLSPAPTNSPNDPVDGQVFITVPARRTDSAAAAPVAAAPAATLVLDAVLGGAGQVAPIEAPSASDSGLPAGPSAIATPGRWWGRSRPSQAAASAKFKNQLFV